MVDNHFDTGILLFEGSYDPITRTISYTSETEDSLGVKQKNWRLIRFVDKNHYVEEEYVEEKGSKIKLKTLLVQPSAQALLSVNAQIVHLN